MKEGTVMNTRFTPTEIKKLSEKMGKCTFCNSDKSKITSISKGASKGSYYQGLCNKCYARGPKTSSPYSALDKWNSLYFSENVPDFILDNTQIERLVNGEIVIRCKTQMEFNALLNKITEIATNSSIDDWYFWGKYKEDTAVIISDAHDGELVFGFSNIEYLKSENYTIEDLIIA